MKLTMRVICDIYCILFFYHYYFHHNCVYFSLKSYTYIYICIFLRIYLISYYSQSAAAAATKKNEVANFATMDVFQTVQEKDQWLRCRPILSKNQRKQETMKFEQTFSRFNREFYFPKHLSHEFEKYMYTF